MALTCRDFLADGTEYGTTPANGTRLVAELQAARTRLNAAGVRIGQFQELVDNLPYGNPDGTTPTVEAVRIFFPGEPSSIPIPLIDAGLGYQLGPPFGECVYHLHTTLEYLKVAILRAPGSDDARGRSGQKYFPLFACEQAYEKHLLGRGKWINRLASPLQDLLRELQPYRSPTRGSTAGDLARRIPNRQARSVDPIVD